MMLFEFSIDLKNEITRLIGDHKIIIPAQIIEELKILSEQGKGKKKTKAKASLKIIEKYETVDSKGKGDDSVLYLAERLKGIILTNDKELRKRAKNKSLQTMFLREKSKLMLG
jgi:hypothetical protein